MNDDQLDTAVFSLQFLILLLILILPLPIYCLVLASRNAPRAS